jgi:hypothetical protein
MPAFRLRDFCWRLDHALGGILPLRGDRWTAGLLNADAKPNRSSVGVAQRLRRGGGLLDLPRRFTRPVGMIFKGSWPAKDRKTTIARVADEQPACTRYRPIEMREDAVKQILSVIGVHSTTWPVESTVSTTRAVTTLRFENPGRFFIECSNAAKLGRCRFYPNRLGLAYSTQIGGNQGNRARSSWQRCATLDLSESPDSFAGDFHGLHRREFRGFGCAPLPLLRRPDDHRRNVRSRDRHFMIVAALPVTQRRAISVEAREVPQSNVDGGSRS